MRRAPSSRRPVRAASEQHDGEHGSSKARQGDGARARDTALGEVLAALEIARVPRQRSGLLGERGVVAHRCQRQCLIIEPS